MYWCLSYVSSEVDFQHQDVSLSVLSPSSWTAGDRQEGRLAQETPLQPSLRDALPLLTAFVIGIMDAAQACTPSTRSILCAVYSEIHHGTKPGSRIWSTIFGQHRHHSLFRWRYRYKYAVPWILEILVTGTRTRAIWPGYYARVAGSLSLLCKASYKAQKSSRALGGSRWTRFHFILSPGSLRSLMVSEASRLLYQANRSPRSAHGQSPRALR